MDPNLKEILSHFAIEGEITNTEKVITGHINDSYKIKTSQPGNPGYFLQWINSYIFRNVDSLMNNISAVTAHLAEKRQADPGLDFEVLEIIPTLDKKKYFIDNSGEFWRLYKYIDNAHVYDVVENTQIAYEGGKAFGRFISLLADLPARQLSEIIPDFHNMEKRLENFYTSVKNNPFNRLQEIAPELEFVDQHREEMLRIPRLIAEDLLPLRITHNDTKFNNILFDSTNHAMCIVDLDTVMPGSLLFDFGDAIRTGANLAGEDEKDLSKVGINIPIYEAYTKGFLKSTRSTLVPAEVENLAFSARFMTFIIGLRFLTDFVDGDPYFRTLYPNHNLDRARVQFTLMKDMEKHAEIMQDIVKQAIDEN
jgi:thiamine kinase-like enzyme